MNTDGQTWQGCVCHLASEPGEAGDMKGGKRRDNANKRELHNDTEAISHNNRGRNDQTRIAATGETHVSAMQPVPPNQMPEQNHAP